MHDVKQHQVLLEESEVPTRWHNVIHDLPTPPAPVLHPGTGQPIGPEDLAPLFATALCGHGHLDLPAYAAYLAGSVEDTSWEDADPQAGVAEALTTLPQTV